MPPSGVSKCSVRCQHHLYRFKVRQVHSGLLSHDDLAADKCADFLITTLLVRICTHGTGPGSANDLSQPIIHQRGVGTAVSVGGQAYPGLPLIVARNDAALGLFNGISAV